MKEYYENEAISQSKLKLLLGNDPKKFEQVKEDSKLYFEEKEHFLIGSAVDFCLTQPHEEFNSVYYISNLETKPSDTIKSIINMVFDSVVENVSIKDVGNISDYSSTILDACNQHEYQKRWVDLTKVSKICEYYEYWDSLKESYGKIILSQEESTLIDTIVMSIRTNEVTSVYFKSDTLYQMPIYFEYEGVNCKALLDMVNIDHVKKEIQPIDIKTLGDNTLNFPKSVFRNRYDIQGAFYTEALKKKYPGYTVLPFKFIVESTVSPGTPLVYTMHHSLLYIGQYGQPKGFLKKHTYSNTSSYYYYVRQKEIKGFHQLIELYKFYSAERFDKDKKIVDNLGELTLDWSGIIEE